MAHDLLPEDEKNTLLLAIDFLDKYDYTDSFMARKYCLNRSTLHLVRKGKFLKNSHAHYIRCYLKEMNKLLEDAKSRMEACDYRKIKDLMFDIMLSEFGI